MNDNHHGDPVGRPFQAVTDGLERPSYEEIREARLTAYALGQLDGQEKAVVEAELATSPAARLEVKDIQALAEQVREANRGIVVPPSETLRAALELQLSRPPIQMAPRLANALRIPPLPHTPTRRSWRAWAALAAAVCLLAGAVGLYLGHRHRGTEPDPGQVAMERVATPAQSPEPEPRAPGASGGAPQSPGARPSVAGKAIPKSDPADAVRVAAKSPPADASMSDEGWRLHLGEPESPSRWVVKDTVPTPEKVDSDKIPSPISPHSVGAPTVQGPGSSKPSPESIAAKALEGSGSQDGSAAAMAGSFPRRPKHMPATDGKFLIYMAVKPPGISDLTPAERPRKAKIPGAPSGLGKFGTGIRAPGAGEAASDAEDTNPTRPENISTKSRPSETHLALPPGMRSDPGKSSGPSKTGRDAAKPGKKGKTPLPVPADIDVPDEPAPDVMAENDFLPAAKFPYSAFSLEVDRTTYPKVGRFLHAGHLPRPDQVQIEDLVNYFQYDDPQPRSDVPFAVRVEAADCPWARDHRLVRIAIVGQDAPAAGEEQGGAGERRSPPSANDVRAQLEFNPARVANYRLIGYDGPPIGVKKPHGGLVTGLSFAAGQTVTALYELVPAKPSQPVVAEARPPKSHRTPTRDLTAVDASSVLLTVRLRYQRPGDEAYRLLEVPWTDPGQSFDASSRDFRFAAAVAAFGMALRGSQYRGEISLEAVERIADSARGEDPQRAEFVDLVRRARQIGAGR